MAEPLFQAPPIKYNLSTCCLCSRMTPGELDRARRHWWKKRAGGKINEQYMSDSFVTSWGADDEPGDLLVHDQRHRQEGDLRRSWER